MNVRWRFDPITFWRVSSPTTGASKTYTTEWRFRHTCRTVTSVFAVLPADNGVWSVWSTIDVVMCACAWRAPVNTHAVILHVQGFWQGPWIVTKQLVKLQEGSLCGRSNKITDIWPKALMFAAIMGAWYAAIHVHVLKVRSLHIEGDSPILTWFLYNKLMSV